MNKVIQPKIDQTKEISWEKATQETFFLDFLVTKNPQQKIKLSNVTLDSCIFRGIDFASNVILEEVDLWDCIFENCDLSNTHFYNKGIHRCVFKNCKLTGTEFIQCSLQDISIHNSNAIYSNITDCSIKRVEILETNMTNSTFINNKVKEMMIDDCNFQEAEFVKTSLAQIDFSTSIISGIRVDFESIKGMKVNALQATDLVSLLGITIV